MLVVSNSILLLVCIETVVCLFIKASVGKATRQIWIITIFLTLCDIEPVDVLIFKDLLALVLPQVVLENLGGLLTRHRELNLIATSADLPMLLSLHLRASLRFLGARSHLR